MKPMWRLHVPSRMRLVEPPLTTKLVVPRREIVGKLSEVFGKLSGISHHALRATWKNFNQSATSISDYVIPSCIAR